MAEPSIRALIFDVDGTLAETEELHRQSFNRAFAGAGLDIVWDQSLYRELLAVTGGKRRILHYFEQQGRPLDRSMVALAAGLHAAKNRYYAETLAKDGLELRPGVARLIADAHDNGQKVALATTTGRGNLVALLNAVATALPVDGFDAVVTGEDVSVLKPHPEAYLLALGKLSLRGAECLAFEDSEAGLRAAVGAGIRTVVTPSIYTRHQDFSAAIQVLPDLSSFHWNL
ncbi:MAG: HAD-IA family hydrolase [Devosia sp.]